MRNKRESFDRVLNFIYLNAFVKVSFTTNLIDYLKILEIMYQIRRKKIRNFIKEYPNYVICISFLKNYKNTFL